MEEGSFLNTIVGAGGLALGLLALINEELRTQAAIAAVALILAVVVFQLYIEFDNLKKEQKRTKERIDIYKELIDIKADIKNLKRERK